MRIIIGTFAVVLVLIATAISANDSEVKRKPDRFWKRFENGLRVAIISDFTVVVPNEKITLTLILNNDTDKEIWVPAPDKTAFQFYDGQKSISEHPKFHGGEYRVRIVDPGATLIYSMTYVWKKPGVYDTYFESMQNFQSIRTLDHKITVKEKVVRGANMQVEPTP